MQDPLEFYQSEKQTFEKEAASLKKKLTTYGTLRLLTFLGTSLGIYFFFNTANMAIAIALTGILLFLYLISKHTDLQRKRDLTKALIKINQLEIDVIGGDFFSLDDGKEFIDPEHYYSYDIDLFGKGSFFQYTNRTATKEGKIKLAGIFTQNAITNIDTKQVAIKELAQMPKWRQQFSAIASLARVAHPAKEIVSWIQNHQSAFPKFLSFLPILFSAISISILGLVGFGILNFQALVIWFFIGLGITGIFLKKINTLYEAAGKAKETFRQYHRLLDKIETASFTSPLLKKKQEIIQTESQKASQIFSRFSKTLDALDQRNNIFIAILANGLLLRDLKISDHIEKWIKNYHDQVENWFEVISFFDASNSLANYAFNHTTYVFPKLNNNSNTLKAIDLGHPLIQNKNRVNNNFTIKNKEFFIVTGANMAGKSTFLRTVSLNIVMANIGLPVCAKNFDYNPIKVITSMRTSDSLANDASYFFSELKRLKFIVDEIKKDEYFIVLDEILKGTNSTDKAKGSKKFVNKLVSSGSTGIIATHDLSLCTIEKEFDQIQNCYFDAEIINDELFFDYKLKKGICKNMNASFLLKKMEII